MTYTELINPETEPCSICDKEIPGGATAYSSEDCEIICQDCYNGEIDKADVAYDAWKEEQPGEGQNSLLCDFPI